MRRYVYLRMCYPDDPCRRRIVPRLLEAYTCTYRPRRPGPRDRRPVMAERERPDRPVWETRPIEETDG